MSDLPPMNEVTYIGDGLYASFDGFQITLRAPRIGCDHYVALEPAVFKTLLRWLRQYPSLQRHMGLP